MAVICVLGVILLIVGSIMVVYNMNGKRGGE